MRIALVDPSRTTRLIVTRMLRSARPRGGPLRRRARGAQRDRDRSPYRCADHIRRAHPYDRARALLGDQAARDLQASDLRADDVLSIRPAEPGRGARFRRRRLHRQAANGRGAVCAPACCRAHRLDAARAASPRHHRSADRAVQSARLLRASDRGARADDPRRQSVRHSPRHRQFQADQRHLRPRSGRRGDPGVCPSRAS